MDPKNWVVAPDGPNEFEAPLFHYVNGEKKLIGVGVAVRAVDRMHAAVTVDDDVVKMWGINLTFLVDTNPFNPLAEKVSIVSQPQEIHTDETMEKLRDVLLRWIPNEDMPNVISALQNEGLLFRERNPESLWPQ